MRLIKTHNAVQIKDLSHREQILHMLVKANLTGDVSDYFRGCHSSLADALGNNQRSTLIYRDDLMMCNTNVQVGWRFNELVKKIEVYVREIEALSCEIITNYSIWLDPAELTKDKL